LEEFTLKIFECFIVALLSVFFILIPFGAHGEFESEFPEILKNVLKFSEGVKGKSLKGAEEDHAKELFSWISSPGSTLGITNRPNPILNGQSGTISLWINHTSPYFTPKNIFDTLMEKNRVRLDVGPFRRVSVNKWESWRWFGGRISASVIDEKGKVTSLFSKIILEGSWYHIAFVWDSKYARLYINGSEAAVKRQPAVPDLNEPPYFYLNRTFSGDLDEVMIFDKPLSSEKILMLAQKKDLSDEKSLVFYLPLDGSSNYLTRRHEIPFPARVKITFPKDRYGYFPLGRKLPVDIIIPAAAGLTGEYEAVISLFDVNNQEIFTSQKKFPLL
jgi:hypothetical protein